MALSAGTRLGPYEILAPLGAGGMGEVYRAKDTRLDRTVAIKVLPSDLAADPHLKARFEREARAISALAHPNICTLHDVGEENGQTFLVMEHLVGQTLAERLKKGPLPLDRALEVATQIADALAAAHKQGIVHRDLKPGNVMLTKTGARLLDFGLARLTAHGEQPAVGSLTSAPTEAEPLTGAGTVMGTLPYMAPEQVEGKEADARTDLWALGLILYEMLTGGRAFEASTPTSLVGAILEREPSPITERQPLTPPSLERLVRRCLAKDPDDRWDTAHDVADELRWVAEAAPDASRARSSPRWSIPALVAGVVVALLAGALAGWLGGSSTSAQGQGRVSRFVIPTPGLAVGDAVAALSPEGTKLVYVREMNESTQLYLREMDGFEVAPIPGTEGARNPFFSPDGEWIGFHADGKLKKQAISGGGVPVALCDTDLIRGASWGPDDAIFFGLITSGLMRVSAAGGAPEVVTELDFEKRELSHRWPEVLPGGSGVLFAAGVGLNYSNIAVFSPQTGERRTLIEGARYPRYAPSGHLVFLKGATVMAAPFDIHRLMLTGSPVAVLEGVAAGRSRSAHLHISQDGTLVYMPGGALIPESDLVWVDRAGTPEPIPAPRRRYGYPSLSPNGQRLAITTDEERLGTAQGNRMETWTLHLSTGVLTRFTFEGSNHIPIWTPDGERLVFTSDREGPAALFWKRSDGSGLAEKLTEGRNHHDAGSWSPDGSVLAFAERAPATSWDIWLLHLGGDRRVEPFIQTQFDEGNPMISPDGRWLAYASDESGQSEVYVQPFPDGGAKWQVSTGGGEEPLWSSDGRELFYRVGEKVMAVPIQTAPTFSAERPKMLFEGPYSGRAGGGSPNYDVAPDGTRFLMIKPVEEASVAELRVVLNWFEELKRLVPTD